MMAGSGAPRPLPWAFLPFFLAASLFAALAVPLWVMQFAGRLPPMHADPAMWHGHEMLFGYALAVVAGYLLTRPSAAAMALCLAAWLAGRVVAVAPQLPATLVVSGTLALPLCLLWFAGWPFLRAARRARNLVFLVPLGGFVLAAAMFAVGQLGWAEHGEARGLRLGIDLIALLLFTMGRRVIAASTSGALQRRGTHLAGVAQPRLEANGVGALLLMLLADQSDRLAPLSAIGAATAGAVILLRLGRWHFWHVVRDFEVSSLHLGYAWLALGLLLQAAAAGDLISPADAVHGITIGALGTLTAVMMIRTTLQRHRYPVVLPPLGIAVVALISLAAVLRLAASLTGDRHHLIELAALAWSLSFAGLAVWLVTRLIGADRKFARL